MGLVDCPPYAEAVVVAKAPAVVAKWGAGVGTEVAVATTLPSPVPEG